MQREESVLDLDAYLETQQQNSTGEAKEDSSNTMANAQWELHHDPEDAEFWNQPPGKGEAIWVDFRHNFYKVKNIDTQNECAFVDVEVAYIWTEPRLIGWEEALPPKLWGPYPQLENGLDDMNEFQTQFVILDNKTGRMKRSIRYRGSVDRPMNLRDFPFDIMAVEMHFDSTSTSLTFDWETKGQSKKPSYRLRRVTEGIGEGQQISFRFSGVITEWKLLGIELDVVEHPENAQGEVHISKDVRFHVARKSSYYFWKVLSPLYLLTILSYVVFAFETDNLSDRIATVSTFFLAAFAMLYVVGESLPKTDFLTSIDKVIVVATVTLMLLGVKSVVLNEVSKSDGIEVADRWNLIMLYIFTAAFILFNVVFFLPSIRKRNRALGKINDMMKAQKKSINTNVEFGGFDQPNDTETWPYFRSTAQFLPK